MEWLDQPIGTAGEVACLLLVLSFIVILARRQ
jgi:hypothetical protein